ncbi:hypothetical protein RCO27_17720 [Sphingosinicella sp. LHD-64]|uniref:hypothetical protein n=1 Tax=Sphingosinicella sp. LHD-64 TaxID=3072139 RepID=UPI00280DE3F8|nr:hypothetical protein [Sphingosinicella sp. LHD-64]MDQ8758069.1 hypothetical protein [Sphingosinicella sp. LHD-64]
MRLHAGLLSLALLAGCAGHVADYVGPRSTIITPQLVRYGYTVVETRCVGETLGRTVRPGRLRDLAAAAGAVNRGFYNPAELGVRDLVWVATTIGSRTRSALEQANRDCGVAAEPAQPPVVAVAAPPPVPPAAWLNLGAAGSGQSIAVDAATIERTEGRRAAWFRLTDPGADPSPDLFHLVVDCGARTIDATERRRIGADGSVVERREYPSNPLPVEDDTVMQIAWMSLCT